MGWNWLEVQISLFMQSYSKVDVNQTYSSYLSFPVGRGFWMVVGRLGLANSEQSTCILF